MIHNPININNISLSFGNKICFSEFSAKIYYRNKIGIIGNNGTGKSSLLKLIMKEIEPSSGSINIPEEVKIGYVPQTIEDKTTLSGGERFLKSLSNVLGQDMNLLLLDEPTNHLDYDNRKSLMKMLNRFSETLIVISHDEELLKNCVNIIWNIDEQKVNIFSGKYEDYLREQEINRDKNLGSLLDLKKEQKNLRSSLQFEQERAGKSKTNLKNKREKDRSLRNKMKDTASRTTGKNKKKILELKKEIDEKLQNFKKIEIITPTFNISPKYIGSSKTLISIVNGSISYKDSNTEVLKDIFLSINSNDRLLITGKNGSGKTSLIRAILNDPNIEKSGDWIIPKSESIGYLDQHYNTINPNISILDNIKKIIPYESEAEIRKTLSTFLFRTNEDVNTLCKDLSGGEKARLSLAQISVKTPSLLILDEITNNIDLNTKKHIIEILKEYPGALIIISHDKEFVKKVSINKEYNIN